MKYLVVIEKGPASFGAYVPDLPGWGKSEKPPHALTVPQATDALAAWMGEVGLSHAVLIGNSLGCQFIVDLVAKRIQALPLFFRVGFGHARIFMDARNTHLMNKLHFTFADEP